MIKAKDIYLRSVEDVNYREGILETGNPLEIFINKIKMILNTSPGEVFGFPEFGVGLESIMFDTNINIDLLKTHINEQILTYCNESSFFDTKIDIQFFKGTVKDWVLIDIHIDGTKEFGIVIK